MAKKQRGKAASGCKRPGLLAGVLAAATLAAGLCSCSAGFPELKMAGFRIGQEEYLRAMYQARSDVLSDHAAAGISLKDWSAETALGDPCRMTMDRALEHLREYYAVSTLAAERGYLADAGYDAMLDELSERNRQRQAAILAGEPVTGLPSFTTDDYIRYRASGFRLQFCNDPENPENQVTQEEILQRYEADRDDLYRQPDSVELAFLTADGADEALEQKFEALRLKTLETGELSAALDAFPELKGYYQEISVTPGSYGVYARSHGAVLTCAAQLQSGELSQVVRQEDWICLVQCRQRTVHGYVPLEDIESVVVQSIRESRYDALIAGRMAEMELKGDLEKLYRFTAEQLCG